MHREVTSLPGLGGSLWGAVKNRYHIFPCIVLLYHLTARHSKISWIGCAACNLIKYLWWGGTAVSRIWTKTPNLQLQWYIGIWEEAVLFVLAYICGYWIYVLRSIYWSVYHTFVLWQICVHIHADQMWQTWCWERGGGEHKLPVFVFKIMVSKTVTYVLRSVKYSQ